MVNIQDAVEAAVAGFAAAFALGADPNVSMDKYSQEVASYFMPDYTTFVLGKVTTAPNSSYTAEGLASLVTEFNKLGLGSDIRVVDSRIEIVSPQSALAWLNIRVFPASACEAGFNWTNVYGYRLKERSNGMPGGWEFVVSDNEIAEISKRYPQAVS